MQYTPPPELVIEADGPVRILTMNNPDMLNAFVGPLHLAMGDVWQHLSEDDDCRAVVVTGAGRAFSAGGDIPGFIRNYESMDHRRNDLRRAKRLMDAMAAFPKPVVAAVNGPAVGLGCSVAVLCDIVLISDATFMADPHVSIGLVAGDGGAVSWPLFMSLLKAKEYLFTGDRIPAAKAVELGLANRVVPAGEVLAEATALAHRLAGLPRQALQETKRALNLHLQAAIDRVAPFALAAESESFVTDDIKRTIDTFKQK